MVGFGQRPCYVCDRSSHTSLPQPYRPCPFYPHDPPLQDFGLSRMRNTAVETQNPEAGTVSKERYRMCTFACTA